MKKNTNSKILFALSLMFATSALGLISFGTMCAFQNKEQQSFEYQTDIKPLTSYFDGGIGTLSNPYIISSEETFINFQKLVQLGCFTYNTYFNLGADITFSDDTILEPIGTENCPFNSQFDGMGYKLSNIKVSSVNHEDVGVFGYVGSGSYIKNLILDTPSITSTGPSTKVDNPLEGIVPSSSITTPTYTTTSVTMSSRVVEGTDSNNYTVYFRSANKGILTDDGVLQTANITNNKKFAIHVDAIITTSILVNNEPMVVTYVADRFAVYIENKAILETEGVVSLFDRSDDGDGTYTTKDPHYYEDQNGARVLDDVVYLGLFVGHIDGEASYIGVYNGTLTANTRETISHSSIIGKHKDDTLLNSLDNDYYYQDINFSEMITAVPSLGDTGYVNTQNFSASTGVGHDTDFTTIFNNTNTNLEDIGIEIPNAFRIYNSFGVSPLDSINTRQLDEETGEISTEIEPMEGIYLKEDIEESITWKTVQYRFYIGNYSTMHTVKNYVLNNTLWLWAMQEYLANGDSTISDILGNLFDGETTVYLTLKISYSVSNCEAAKDTIFKLYSAGFSTKSVPNDTYNNKLSADSIDQFGHANNSNITKKTIVTGTDESGNDITTEEWHFTDMESSIAPVEYIDSDGNIQTKDFDPLICSQNTSYSNVIQSKTISVVANTSSSSSFFNRSTYAPLFGLGLEGINGTNAQLDIYRIEILISHDQGNFSYSLDKVDFLYDLNATYDSSAATWTGWAKKESGVKIYFILQDLEDGDTNTNLNTGVVITYTRSSGYGYRVTATYTVLGDASYAPTNTSGAQTATITDGT
ncbi:MAG: hypothetical protein ACI311_03915 [Bacilli bacterium]